MCGIGRYVGSAGMRTMDMGHEAIGIHVVSMRVWGTGSMRHALSRSSMVSMRNSGGRVSIGEKVPDALPFWPPLLPLLPPLLPSLLPLVPSM